MTGPDLPLVHERRPPADGDGAAPAVVLLHGRGADEHDLLPIGEALPDALDVLSVRAPDRLQGGYTWYELDLSGGGLHHSQPDAADFRRSLDLVHGFVEAAVAAYDLDPERVGLLGFSQGAITALSALLERPGSYAWAVALNGYLADAHDDPASLDGAAGKPVFLAAGRGDRVIPAERAERAAERLREAGLEVTFETYPVGHGTTPAEVRAVAEWVDRRLSG